jgi:hypothetical protein
MSLLEEGEIFTHETLSVACTPTQRWENCWDEALLTEKLICDKTKIQALRKRKANRERLTEALVAKFLKR